MQFSILAVTLLLVTSSWSQSNQISLGLSHFEFGSYVTFPEALADINNDGKLDIVGYDFGNGAISVLLGNGNGTFQPPRKSKLDVGFGNYTLAIADFNSDGKLDLVGVGGQIVLLLGNGDGTFQADQVLSTSLNASSVASADLNHDGKQDLIVGGIGQVAILLGNGDGTFQPEQVYDQGDDLDVSLAIADFNGDGNLDIVTDGQDDALSLLLGSSDGTFGPAIQIPLSFYPEFLLTADLNGDGRPDLVAQFSGYGLNLSTVGVFLGDGDGTFQGEADYFAVGDTAGLAAGNMNGDGAVDLITASRQESVATVLPGRGDGTFGPPSFAAVYGSPYAIAVGDIDGDGLDDIATLAPLTHTVSVLRHGVSVLSKTLVNFGHVPIGRQKTTPITITNFGNVPFTVMSTQITGAYSQNYTHTSVCDGVVLNPAASCTLRVGLVPTSKYQKGAALVITSDGTPGTQSVTLYGTTD